VRVGAGGVGGGADAGWLAKGAGVWGRESAGGDLSSATHLTLLPPPPRAQLSLYDVMPSGCVSDLLKVLEDWVRDQ